VALFGANLLDKKYYAGGVDYTGIVGSPHYDVGRPREWGVSLKARF
jgi:iron complex outermembrane receptor protein